MAAVAARDYPYASIIVYGRRCPALAKVRDEFISLTWRGPPPGNNSWEVSLAFDPDYVRSELARMTLAVVVRVMLRGVEQPIGDDWSGYAERGREDEEDVPDVPLADFVDVNLDMAQDGDRNVVAEAFDACKRCLSARFLRRAVRPVVRGDEDDEEVFRENPVTLALERQRGLERVRGRPVVRRPSPAKPTIDEVYVMKSNTLIKRLEQQRMEQDEKRRRPAGGFSDVL